MHNKLGSLDPCDKYMQTNRNNDIIRLCKTISEERIIATEATDTLLN